MLHRIDIRHIWTILGLRIEQKENALCTKYYSSATANEWAGDSNRDKRGKMRQDRAITTGYTTNVWDCAAGTVNIFAQISSDILAEV